MTIFVFQTYIAMISRIRFFKEDLLLKTFELVYRYLAFLWSSSPPIEFEIKYFLGELPRLENVLRQDIQTLARL